MTDRTLMDIKDKNARARCSASDQGERGSVPVSAAQLVQGYVAVIGRSKHRKSEYWGGDWVMLSMIFASMLVL